MKISNTHHRTKNGIIKRNPPKSKMTIPNWKQGYNILMEYFDSISDEEKPKLNKKLSEIEGNGLMTEAKYRQAYQELMTYWDSYPDEEKADIDKRLKRAGV